MEDEMPPEWMWPFEDELIAWFDDVEAKRKAKYSGNSADDDDDNEGLVLSNELARGKK